MSKSHRVSVSANATTHGLRGSGLLLPCEDEETYAASLRGVLATLSPVGTAETHVVVALADLFWRQKRWLRATDTGTMMALEQRMKSTPEHLSAVEIKNALAALNAMLNVVDVCGAVRQSSVQPLVDGARGTFALIADLGGSTASLGTFSAAIHALDEATTDAAAAQAILLVRESGAVLRRNLLRRAKAAEKGVERIQRLLSAVASPEAGDGQRLARYGRMIDSAAEAQLRLLTGLQEQRRAARGKRKRAGDSEPVPVQLRIVR